MKKLSIILVLIIVVISCKGNESNPTDSIASKATKENQQTLKRYNVKSGIVKYKTTISGNVMGSTITGSGTESLYFKDWGALELKETKSSQKTIVKVFGKETTETTSSHTINKLDKGESYLADFGKKLIYVTRDPLMDYMKQSNTDVGEAGKSMLESMGGKKVGEETYLGYNCEMWSILNGKQWMHKGVVLKIDLTVLGIRTLTEATSAKFDVSVSDSNFELPDFPIQKTEGFMDNEEYKEDLEEMDENIEMISKLSYEDWKKLALADKEDEEMQNMSEEELREMYDMMQKMIKMRQGN